MESIIAFSDSFVSEAQNVSVPILYAMLNYITDTNPMVASGNHVVRLPEYFILFTKLIQ